jgi:hypothetical protein
MTQRIEWPGGWAELEPRLTHGRRMRVVRVLPFGEAVSTPAEKYEFGAEIVAAHVKSWSVGEVDPVRGPAVDALDALPQDAFDALMAAAIASWTGRADPNASSAKSDGGSAVPV